MKQVEGHLRICLKADATLDSMETVSPSEPLLSEAAYVIMSRKSFKPLEAFKSILEGFAIHQGDRGEFLALLLLTLARDQAVGLPDKQGHPKCRFFRLSSFLNGNLFSTASADLTPKTRKALNMLEQDFPNATMHCNHFIKLHDFKSVNMESLLLLMTRGAGVMCANSQASIDAANIFLLSGTKFHTTNAGTIAYQMKNNEDYTHKPKPKLFASMNPYDLNILEPEDDAIPLIRIILPLLPRLQVFMSPGTPQRLPTVPSFMTFGVLAFPPNF